VVSGTLKEAEWQGTTVIRDDVPTQIAELKRRHGREIQVHGSGDLAQTLLANNLVDELHLWIYPIVLGTGKRPFPPGIAPAAFSLADTRKTSTGVLVNRYRRAGKPAYGSFALDQG
jgi:dihydrofolate reductase